VSGTPPSTVPEAAGRELAASRVQANRTRAAAAPSIQLLSPPSVLRPDAMFDAMGRVRKRHGYDMGLPPPPLPPGSAGRRVQSLHRSDAYEHVLESTAGFFPYSKQLRYGVRRLLGWLDRFDGDTWERRWLASGADLAPRSWRVGVEPATPGSVLKPAVNALMVARLLRPSYGWQLAFKAGAHLPQRMLQINEPDQLEQLRRCRPTGRRWPGISWTPRRAWRGS
jgi:hypothetical protein